MKQVEALPAKMAKMALSEYIGERIESLPKSQRDVACYIVDHIDEAAFQTAEELARRVQTSSSTVVRFSQNLGFEGFPELQRAAQAEYRAKPVKKSKNGRVKEPVFVALDKSEFETSLATDYANIEETASRNKRKKLESITQAVVKADAILVFSLDQLGYIGQYFRYLLDLLGIKIELVTASNQDGLRKIAQINSRTLVIGIVAGKVDPILIRAFKLARHRKGVAALVADSTLSEISKLANISFYYSSNSPSYARSHTALLSFAQGLAYEIYAQDSDSFDSRLNHSNRQVAP